VNKSAAARQYGEIQAIDDGIIIRKYENLIIQNNKIKIRYVQHLTNNQKYIIVFNTIY